MVSKIIKIQLVFSIVFTIFISNIFSQSIYYYEDFSSLPNYNAKWWSGFWYGKEGRRTSSSSSCAINVAGGTFKHTGLKNNSDWSLLGI